MVGRLQPGGHSRCLPPVDPRVEVTRRVQVDLWIQDGEEAPDHGKDPADVRRGRQSLHVAKVKAGICAGETTEVGVEDRAGLEVVVDSYDPARVELWQKL